MGEGSVQWVGTNSTAVTVPEGPCVTFATQGMLATAVRTSVAQLAMLSDTAIKLDIRGERERSPPLTKITHPSHPHLGRSQASAQPECNGRASPWGHRLLDHGSPCAR